MVKNLVITATNSLYFDSLLTLISSVHEHSFDVVDEIVVFNLGLTTNELSHLDTLEKVKVINFTAEEMNSHPHFMTPKWFVYKLTCIRNGFDYGKNILWLDSGVCALSSIKVIFDKIEEEDIFFVVDTHLIKTYTHTNCRNLMSATDSELEDKIISAGIFGYKSDGKYNHIINEAYEYSLIPGCCDGDQENHRHDQSILSILKARYNCPTNDIDIYGYWTDINRNLQTAKQNGAVIFVHRRGHSDKKELRYKNQKPKNDEIISNSENVTYVNNNIEPKLKINLFDENLTGQDGLSRYISPKLNWLRNDNNPDYEVAIYTDRFAYNKEIDETKQNYIWLIEPPIINGENYSNIQNISKKFKKVFSYNTSLKDKIDNFEFIPHGGTWLNESEIRLHDKNKDMSFVYSDKQWAIGHKLRHRLSNILKEHKSKVDLFGTGSGNQIEYKISALEKYRFSIVIENSLTDDYFTEKILDCFLTGTIPIYFGTKNIINYFDSDGIIFLPKITEYDFDMNETLKLIESCDEQLYNTKLESVINNFNEAQKYIFPEKIIQEKIENNFL
jgi:hypothetical protein